MPLKGGFKEQKWVQSFEVQSIHALIFSFMFIFISNSLSYFYTRNVTVLITNGMLPYYYLRKLLCSEVFIAMFPVWKTNIKKNQNKFDGNLGQLQLSWLSNDCNSTHVLRTNVSGCFVVGGEGPFVRLQCFLATENATVVWMNNVSMSSALSSKRALNKSIQWL